MFLNRKNFPFYDMIKEMPFLPILLSLLCFMFSPQVLADHAPTSGLTQTDHQADPPPALRVRVLKKVHELEISGENIRASDAHQHMIYPVGQKSNWEIVCQGGRISVKSKALSPTKAISWASRSAVSFESPGHVLRLGKNVYRNVLRVSLVDSESCDVVNDVDLEKYLDGLVNSEFSSKWNEEAIAAQVIAARTYAYHQYLEVRRVRRKQHFDVDSTTKDQVYEGVRKESSRASRIAERTRGIVLTTYLAQKQKWEPVKAFYHSACGGLTELPEKVWKRKFAGFKSQIRCSFCKDSPVYQWSLRLSSDEITQSILSHVSEKELRKWRLHELKNLNQPKLLSIETELDSEHTRVLKIDLAWEREGHPYVASLSGARFRDWIGTTRLKSTWFQVDKKNLNARDYWVFHGFGNGHGVGMCQWGAKRMGEQGFSYASILQHYYPGAMLKKIW